MIQSFRDEATLELFVARKSRLWSDVQATALRKLDQLATARELKDLAVPPGNRLEALKGNRAGQHSIRINDKWRICFAWHVDGPHVVEIVDYH